MKKTGLYLHIPFCKEKCHYCDFYSLGCQKNELIEKYIDSLCTHISLDSKSNEQRLIDTIYIGGGTPSLVKEKTFERLAHDVRENFYISENAEFTIEANPGTLTRKSLLAYKKCGVNRLSIGLQSANNKELKALGRIHTYEQFLEGYTLARECGFDNISVDIMYSIPNQSIKDFEKTLSYVCEIAPEHISSYCLKIEDGTRFGQIKPTLALADEETQYQMYLLMCNYLEAHGYKQYEISNFSRLGYHSRHNIKYWMLDEYLGYGPSAHSYIDGKRYYYNNSLEEYIACIESSAIPKKHYETDNFSHSPTKNEQMDEYVMLKLRLCSGINLEEFEKIFSTSFLKEYEGIEKYVKTGHVIFESNTYHFSPKGFFVSNYILTDVLKF